MTGADMQRHDGALEAPRVGDHLAMDLLNTQARSDGADLDYWRSGDDVLGWLARHGALLASRAAAIDRDGLLAQAKALRALARELIARRKAGSDIGADIDKLNGYLHAYLSAPHLARAADGALVLTRVACGEATASLLGPVAEAVAQLLVEGDFALVKQCEHPECILWFYDRTKAHRRRWCSMAVCGNRHKAAQFRKRNGAL